MRPGYGPVRRNRNSGTSKAGRGKDNRFKIPSSHGSVYWEIVGDHSKTSVEVHGRKFSFVVERTKSGFFYACPVDDVVKLLSMIPHRDLEQLQAIVFRQSTRKQKVSAPTWGRLDYWAELRSGRALISCGPTVFLEAVESVEECKLSCSESLQESRERDRLVRDGHQVRSDGRRFTVTSTPEACRNTQLYRTLLHEIGHWVDWLTKVDRPTVSGNFEQLSNRYFQRPALEREVFAHRYASEMNEMLQKQGLVPFKRIFDPAEIRARGLRVEDFQILPEQ